jgi:hypothetical protein
MRCNREDHSWAIDDETIELHAMGRLKDSAVRQHVDTCTSCTARVVERRQWIADLKRVLRAYRDSESARTTTGQIDAPLRPEDA